MPKTFCRAWLLLLSTFSLHLSSDSFAEPWLGSRFAQNCAGCHAPGRKNLAPIDRRCTLSCQGCHVNPNGGGMRSFYGRWNQDRWLRSYRHSLEQTTKSFVPTTKQHYGKEPFKNNPGKDQWIFFEGLPLVETSETTMNEKKFNKYGKAEKTTALSWKEFLYQVPAMDPYRQFDYSRVDAGGDVRWLWRSLQSESHSNDSVSNSADKWQSFLMSVDVGVRYRPIHRNLHLVYEGRIMGSPADHVQKKDILKTSGTRSLYAMVDNLPFNTFVMGGWYRPLINAATPDHNSLGEKMLASAIIGSPRSQSLLFNAVSVGVAPNVPFANVHYIRRKKLIGGDIDGDATTGFAINMGMRFVTLGGAINYTYWKTSDNNDVTNEKTDTEIFTFGISGQLGRVTAGVEALSLARDQGNTDFRRGGVYSLKTRTRIWRENYAIAHYSMANRTVMLLPGSTSQIKVGARGFHIAGLETMISYDIEKQTSDGKGGETDIADTKTTSHITGQVHFFF